MTKQSLLDVLLLERSSQEGVAPQEDLCRGPVPLVSSPGNNPDNQTKEEGGVQIVGNVLESEQTFKVDSSVLVGSEGLDAIIKVDEQLAGHLGREEGGLGRRGSVEWCLSCMDQREQRWV